MCYTTLTYYKQRKKKGGREEKLAMFLHLSHFHHLTIQRQDFFFKGKFSQYTKVYTLDHSETDETRLWRKKRGVTVFVGVDGRCVEVGFQDAGYVLVPILSARYVGSCCQTMPIIVLTFLCMNVTLL